LDVLVGLLLCRRELEEEINVDIDINAITKRLVGSL
jgi:hypothetical protein